MISLKKENRKSSLRDKINQQDKQIKSMWSDLCTLVLKPDSDRAKTVIQTIKSMAPKQEMKTVEPTEITL